MRWFVAPLVLALVACGGRESVASKSAAAYREAQSKGIPVAGGHEHGGHAATPTTSTTMDHSGGTTADAHAPQDHEGHAGSAAVDHAAMVHGSSAGEDHGAHATAGTSAHAGHTARAGGSAADHSQHAGTQHSSTAGAGTDHSQHAGMQHGTPSSAQTDHSQHGMSPAPATAATPPITRVTGALQQDALDAPSPAAVAEAAKASQVGDHAAHGAMRGITPGEDEENPPTPMPARRDGTNAPPATDHSQHKP